MTSRILSEDGSYIPAPDPVEPEPIDASLLPQKRPSPYANVDTTDFSNAESMTRIQQLTMANIAYERGQSDIAMRWKQVGVQTQQAEANAEAAQRMQDMFTPKPSAYTAGPIVETVGVTPWGQSVEYRKLEQDYRTAQAGAEDAMVAGGDVVVAHEAQQAVAKAEEAMNELKDELRQTAIASGHWTTTDELVGAAMDSLTEKAAQIENLMFGATE